MRVYLQYVFKKGELSSLLCITNGYWYLIHILLKSEWVTRLFFFKIIHLWFRSPLFANESTPSDLPPIIPLPPRFFTPIVWGSFIRLYYPLHSIVPPCTFRYLNSPSVLLSPLTYPCVYTVNITHLPAAFLVSTLFPLYTLFISIEWNFFLSPLFWLLPGSEDIMATRRHKYAVSNTTATVPSCK